jgi:hypothetical protein
VRRALPLLLLALLAGCGGAPEADDPGPEGTPSASASPSPDGSSTPTAVPPAVESERDELAELAEKAATEAPAGTIAPYPAPVLGGDVSWPQCPKGLGIPEKRTLGKPMPLPQARYVVIGLTNGPGFHVNPCLADQVRWARERQLLVSAYAVASFPQGDELARYGQDGPFAGATELDALRNVGYRQAQFNVAAMRAAGLETPFVWVDVEPVPDFPWSTDLVANAAVVEGVARGYVDAGYAIGVYSTPVLWSGVVGGLALGVPEWRAAGQTSRAEAESRCGDDWVIQGGPAVLAQWVEADRDQNVTCGQAHLDLGAWFHPY